MEPNVSRFHQLLSRLFAVRGHTAGQFVLDDVMPIINLLEEDPFLSYGRDELLSTFLVSNISAVAAQYARVLLQAPPGSIIRVDRIRCTSGAASGATMSVLDKRADLASLGGSVPNDMRIGRLALPPSAMTYDTNAVPSAGCTGMLAYQISTLPGGSWIDCLSTPLILGDGMSLLVYNMTVNQTFGCQIDGMLRNIVDATELRP